MMRFLNIENIILFHEKIIKETGGSAGIRDIETWQMPSYFYVRLYSHVFYK